MTPELPDSPTVSVEEAARVLGVNVKTLYGAIHAGQFPAIRLRSRFRISRNVIASTLEQGRVVLTGATNASKTRK